MADHARFMRDVRHHQMIIELDQGVHRSVRFGRPGSSAYYFRLNSWPGHLAISGDMGSYTFARLHDMFIFFRDAGPEYVRDDRINVGYWDEKLTSICRHSGREELDEAAYTQVVRSMLNSHIGRLSLSDAKSVVREAHWDNLFDAPTTVREAEDRLYGLRCPATGRAVFSDLWDRKITAASFHLVWAMRAIQWGIKQYDLHQQGRTQADHDRRILKGHEQPTPARPYFDAMTTSATIPKRGAWAVYAGGQPRRTEAGISYPLRFPMLMLPDYILPQQETAQAVADVLNQNAGRFFPAGGAQAEHDRRVLAGEL